MSSSVRIDLNGQTQGCSNDPVTIDRSLPASLEPHISNSEWNRFCDYVDRALKPIESIKKRATCLLLIGVGASFFLFALIAILGGTLFNSDVNLFPMFIVLGILFVAIPAFMSFCTMKEAEKEMNNVIRDVQRVLSDEGIRRSNISFHWREEVYNAYEGTRNVHNQRRITHYYIECVIASAAVPMGVAVPIQASVVDDSAVGKTTKERLQELEDAKTMLTKEEYKKKKSEILAAL